MSIDHAALNTACFAEFGEDATYTPAGGSAKAVTVIVERGVEYVPGGSDSSMIERRTVLHLIKTEVSAPKRGDVCVVGATTYTVDAVVEDDGHVVRAVVR